MNVEESVTIARTPEDVFAYLADVGNDSNWQKSVVEAKLTSEGPIGVESTGVHRMKFMGMTDDYEWKLHEFDSPNRASWTFVSGPVKGQGGYRLAASGESTSLTWASDVRRSPDTA